MISYKVCDSLIRETIRPVISTFNYEVMLMVTITKCSRLLPPIMRMNLLYLLHGQEYYAKSHNGKTKLNKQRSILVLKVWPALLHIIME